MKIIVESNGKNTILNSIGELVKFCLLNREENFEILWWRDQNNETDENVYGFRDFTHTELRKALEERGEITLQFGHLDKSGDGDIFFIYSEKGFAKMQEEINSEMEDIAQEYANETGKTAKVYNLMGKVVERTPKIII